MKAKVWLVMTPCRGTPEIRASEEAGELVLRIRGATLRGAKLVRSLSKEEAWRECRRRLLDLPVKWPDTLEDLARLLQTEAGREVVRAALRRADSMPDPPDALSRKLAVAERRAPRARRA